MKNLYRRFGVFDNFKKAMEFRNKNYRWCSYKIKKENNNFIILIKIPRI